MPAPTLEHLFCPPVRHWFEATFSAATPAQMAAWAQISSGTDTLVAAPTGSGKTLAAFLCAIDDLVRRSAQRPLEDRVHVLYVSPLKALSNDIHRNLEAPLQGIEALQGSAGKGPAGIRAMVRTGDTPPGERQKMRKQPPHVLVTTPESLYLLLTSQGGRDMLMGTETVIVDEIHALAGNKRGAHLALSLARLDALCGQPPRRIGLSATQKPIHAIASFLTGGRSCAIVDTGHSRERQLHLELPGSGLSAIMAGEVWEEVYDRLAELAGSHRTTLIFVNTRRLAERVARHLAERLGEDAVTAHHGSLSRRHRLESEQALKEGRLSALVATASLELGIDIGHVDLVCQLGSPGSLAAFLQRVGRSGHQVDALPHGRLFPLSRDDLVECVALLRAIGQGELDAIRIPRAPEDVLAQQIVAEVSARDWSCDGLFDLCRSAWPFRDLQREHFDQVLRMLADGYSTRRGRRSAWLFLDVVNGRLRARPAARLTALQNGGAIPDQFDYDVIMLPQGHRIGTLNEDFAFESVPGDVFQLGNTSYRMLRIEQGRVLVEDATGQSPTIPFWFGDRPGRSDELSSAVSQLREQLAQQFAAGGEQAGRSWLQAEGVAADAAALVVEYLFAAWQALGCLPTQDHIVLERFFDDTGDMHLVLHAPRGSRIMRAWGLALRKRFCRQFNFELQASALEDALILSLGETHSFDLLDVTRYLNSASVRQVLVQALLDAPMFEARWRWNATIALAVQRMRNGKKLPPQWQRNQAEDLVSVVFPDQIACAENLAGAREIPDHPLVRQTISDCLFDTMDIEGLERELQRLEQGELQVTCADLTGPSPLAREIISARPYAFLDDGEAENRRTRAISGAGNDLGDAQMLRIISVEACHQVRDEAWISPRNADELHDGLIQLGCLTHSEFATGSSVSGAPGQSLRWGGWFELLADEHRACRLQLDDGSSRWVAAERLGEWQALHPQARAVPAIACAPGVTVPDDAGQALVSLLRDRLAGLGPVCADRLSEDFAVPMADMQAALVALQQQGYAIAMEQGEAEPRWCERRLLARIHRYSREHRRQAVRPVTQAVYARFLVAWHQLDEPGDLDAALSRLEGWAAPVDAWEHALLRSRCREQPPGALDQRFLSGQLAWFRALNNAGNGAQVVAASPVALVPRAHLNDWRVGSTSEGVAAVVPPPTSDGNAGRVLEVLNQQGAMFAADLERATGLLETQLEEGLKALVHQGLVTADAFSPLRWLLRPEREKTRARNAVRRGHAMGPIGRWSLVTTPLPLTATSGAEAAPVTPEADRQRRLSIICEALLRRYGVVFRALLVRETLLPPWRDLLRCLRRMEDRGEVRGGRFVDGFSGEQFALPEALGLLRQCQVPPTRASLVAISAADPLNLGGIIVPGPRTPVQASNRLLLEDGLPVARLVGGEVEMLTGASGEAARRAPDMLRVVTAWRRRRV